MAEYYTQDFDTLKQAVQGALPYSPDLTAATLTTVTEMGADWAALDDPEWTEAFLPTLLFNILPAGPSPVWTLEVTSSDINIAKRSIHIARFINLSNTKWRATLPNLNLAGWVKHP